MKIYSHRVHEDSPYRDRAPSRKLEDSYVSFTLLILSNIFLLFGLNVIAAFKPWRWECQGFDPEGLKFFFLNFQNQSKNFQIP